MCMLTEGTGAGANVAQDFVQHRSPIRSSWRCAVAKMFSHLTGLYGPPLYYNVSHMSLYLYLYLHLYLYLCVCVVSGSLSLSLYIYMYSCINHIDICMAEHFAHGEPSNRETRQDSFWVYPPTSLSVGFEC